MAIGSIDAKFFKSPYGIGRIVEMVLAIAGIIVVAESTYCDYYSRSQFFESTCIATIIFIVICLILSLLGVSDNISQYVHVALLMLCVDVILLILYCVSSIYMILSIGPCKSYRVTRIIASVFAIFNALCFFSSVAVDIAWFKGKPPF